MSRPEIRIDQLTGARVLLAPGRSDRPEGMTAPKRNLKGPEGCPFCEGREGQTPPEFYAVRPGGGEADAPGWLVRSVPNLFPALTQDDGADEGSRRESAGAFSSPADPLRASARSGETDLFSSRPAHGTHEVIINAPDHATTLADLDPDQLKLAVASWRERMRAHPNAAHVQLIVNEGLGAGASLEHSHAQMYALEFVPAAVARERERVTSYAERTGGGSLLLDILVEEVRRKERLVAIDEQAALVCPWASRSPYEMRLIPRRAEARFEHSESGAEMLTTALRLLKARFGHLPALNMWVRTAPRGAETFHWHMDIAPRLTTRASFEMATEVEIDVTAPEQAAAELREYL